MFKVIPVGQGMAMLQSDPMPQAEAQAKLDELNAGEEEMPEEEEGEEMEGEMMDQMPQSRPAAGRPSMPPAMPAFGKNPMGTAAPDGMMGRNQPRRQMPPYSGM
jgi:hypothetical protein